MGIRKASTENISLKLNHGNFRVEIPEQDARCSFSIYIDRSNRLEGISNFGKQRKPQSLPEQQKMVLSNVVTGGYHMLVALNMTGTALLHWGVSKSSAGEWLASPSDKLPEKSKMVVGAYHRHLVGEPFFSQVDGYDKGIVKWLLDEISQREKEAGRSLMHRFNIATELTERCKAEGELGLIGILFWMRFMICRHLTWNRNYNVKPR
ncbi:hypothetical protein CRYUN_Cryun28dG0064000 [Craigia yunnanensis]